MAERINKENFESTVKASPFVLVDFYSDSCIPCKKLNPVLGDLEDELGDTLKVYKLNVNFDIEIAEKYVVTSNPTLIIFKDGNEVDRKTGFQTLDALKSWINEKK